MKELKEAVDMKGLREIAGCVLWSGEVAPYHIALIRYEGYSERQERRGLPRSLAVSPAF